MARHQTPEQIEVRKAKARAKWASLLPEEKRRLRGAAVERERIREQEDGPLLAAERRAAKSARERDRQRAQRASETAEERSVRLAIGREREARRGADGTLRAERLAGYAERNGALGRWESAAKLYQVDLSVLADRCEICGAGESLAVDHDHITGAVRGRLCMNCNVGVGNFRDDTALMEKAIAYLAERRGADFRSHGLGFHPLVRNAVARRLLLMTFAERVQFEREAELDGMPIRVRGRLVRTHRAA